MEWIGGEQWDQFGEDRTDAHRVATGPDGYLDRYGDWALWSGGRVPAVEGLRNEVVDRYGWAPRGVLGRETVRRAADQHPAELLAGEEPGEITVGEGGVKYRVEPAGGYSSGLFLDQRWNRQWVREAAPRRMLNLFAYTGSFTVCAALGGGETCSVDASKRALAKVRENLRCNEIDPAEGHRFLADDVMKVVPRLVKRGEQFDLIVLDPPTFGRADGKVFRIEQDLPGLVGDCFALLEAGGIMLVSCNYAEWNKEDLRGVVAQELRGSKCVWTEGAQPPEIPRGAISWRIGKI